MIVHKIWRQYRRARNYTEHGHFWMMEGWFLFGFIPLYKRDIERRPNR